MTRALGEIDNSLNIDSFLKLQNMIRQFFAELNFNTPWLFYRIGLIVSSSLRVLTIYTGDTLRHFVRVNLKVYLRGVIN